MIEIWCLLILGVVLCFQEIGESKFYASLTMFWVYGLSVVFAYTPLGIYLEDVNFYAIQTLYSALIIGLLSFHINKLSILIMMLEFATIAAHAGGYWIELQYAQTDLHWWIILLVYGVEIALIISNRLVNGVYRGCRKLSVFRWYAVLLAKNDTSGNRSLW